MAKKQSGGILGYLREHQPDDNNSLPDDWKGLLNDFTPKAPQEGAKAYYNGRPLTFKDGHWAFDEPTK